MINMQDLIKRIEAADGPSRELDMDLFNIVADGKFWPENKKFWEHDSWSRRVPIRFTSSIDAAMTLVPEGAHVTITMDGEFWLACVNGSLSRSKCLAPALCAAALRAVMAENEG